MKKPVKHAHRKALISQKKQNKSHVRVPTPRECIVMACSSCPANPKTCGKPYKNF